MAQTEDTELRDLVIEALEKNGSLAKIRALLRANVFLVFEDEGQNLKQNVSLDNILKVPEGAICLSIIHEFLEFCNLKNTLFVYMAESRQGTEYIYEGPKKLAEKINIQKKESIKEPILLTLLKQAVKSNQIKYMNQSKSNSHNLKNHEKLEDNNFNDQNCTYIVHEDSNSSANSNSQSDNSSSDDKNKLHLRLQLDNSDTDTSSDSARDKSCSEYIPNEHILTNTESHKPTQNHCPEIRHVKQSNIYDDRRTDKNYLQELKLFNNSSSESTSYAELKPLNSRDKRLLNTTGVPIAEEEVEDVISVSTQKNIKENSKHMNTIKQGLVSETACIVSLKNDEVYSKYVPSKTPIEDSGKSDADTAEYSNDFTLSIDNKNNDVPDNPPHPPVKEDPEKGLKNASLDSPRQTSQSSQSSISISDVADLISERSSSFGNQNEDNYHIKSPPYIGKKVSNSDRSKLSDGSGDFSESSVPSLSNLSMDIHSD